MKKRIHSSLAYLTPDEYERKWHEQEGKNDNLQQEFLKFFHLLSEARGSLHCDRSLYFLFLALFTERRPANTKLLVAVF